MSTDITQIRIDKYERQFGTSSLLLACHIALPVLFNSELLHLVRINFFLDPPAEPLSYTAEADLLLSDLCLRVSDNLFEMHRDTRDVLIKRLMTTHGMKRIREVALLLWQYSTQHSPWADQESLMKAQMLTALNFIDPAKAREWLEQSREAAIGISEIDERWFVVMHNELDRNSTSLKQRLHELHQNIQRSLDLLRQYERLVQLEDEPPRRLMRYRREIDREKGALEQYEKDAAALGPLSAQTVEGSAIQQSLDTLNQKMHALSQQLDDVDRKLTGGQVNIMAHLVKLDRQQQVHYLALIQRLDKHQLELVDLLLDAAAQQQITQWDAASLTLMTQQALVDLYHLRQNQPDAAQWQSLIALLGQETTWEQKLKWTLPLIPGILSYESETTLGILPTLREAWDRVRNRVVHPDRHAAAARDLPSR